MASNWELWLPGDDVQENSFSTNTAIEKGTTYYSSFLDHLRER